MFYSSVNAQPLGINMICIFWKETVVPGERVAAIFTTDYPQEFSKVLRPYYFTLLFQTPLKLMLITLSSPLHINKQLARRCHFQRFRIDKTRSLDLHSTYSKNNDFSLTEFYVDTEL